MIATACNIIDSWPRCKMAEVVNRFGEFAEKNHLDSDTSFEKAVSEAVESAVTVVEAIQPILVKSVRVAASAAVSMAFKQMRREFEAVEEMKKEAAKVNEEMTRLRARVQQQFTQDRLEQYSNKESVRIYGIPESAEGDPTREDTNEIVVKIATKIGTNSTAQEVSVSHRI